MSLVTAVFAETVHARELPMDPFFYGLIALGVFLVLGIITYSYRDVANRHRFKSEAYAARHGGDDHAAH
ncbi:hypothetical protein [Agromyces aerolatus]|uniref:hypothetical protein n=1 Tax=Agromyces sp. LY-1074 TaxID=3074080 RepID=UPI00285F7C34|nr:MULTISPECIES: hypothetical protein [unclassified Agromyces]MDR5700705.1 hypothetical protein [Agromyces sp. LY-1074]MDR5707226.1 hypothetical protein [Agromyces sp. LY-1358]